LATYAQFSRPSFGYPDFALPARRRTNRRRRLVRRTCIVVAGAVLLGTSGVVAANEIGTHDALWLARSALNTTRQQLAQASAQRDTYQAQLRQAEDQLNQAQQSLSSAQSQVILQGNQITVLKTCLRGVLDSLSYAAANDYTDAISTIDGVSTVCNEASTMLTTTT
jgi:chromosome segregation ATPase